MKYKVELGGFVTVTRHRTLIIHAQDESEAIAKAEEKFIDLQQQNGVCENVFIDNIEEIE